MFRNRTTQTTLLLFLLALAVRLAVAAWWRFDGLYGQDSFAYWQQGQAIWAGLPQGQLPPTDFFWPNGFPLLIAVAMPLLGPTALAGQAVSLLFGAAAAPILYLLSQTLFPTSKHGAGIIAALLVAIAGQPILSSVVVMADMPAMVWATISVWLVALAGQRPGRANGLLLAAGAAIGLAVISRWAYVLVIPALAGAVLLQIQRGQIRWWGPVLPVLGGGLCLLPQLVLSLNRPAGLLHSWLLGWRPGNFLLRQFETVDGRAEYLLPTGVYYAQPAGHPAYIFPLLGLASLWAVWRVWQTRNWPAAILLVGWAGPVFLFLGGIPYQNFRFGLTLYPPLVILAAVGVVEVWRWAAQKSPAWQRLATAGIVLSFLGMMAWAYPMLDRFLSAQNAAKRLVGQIETLLPAEATLLTFGPTLTFQHYGQLETLEFFYCNQADLATLVRTRPALYLLLNLPNIEAQWSGRIPQQNYMWLEENASLIRLESFPPYALFKIEGPGQPLSGEGALSAAPCTASSDN